MERPPQIMKANIPDEKTCMMIPLAQIKIARRQDHSLPIWSFRKNAIHDPKAAPRTPKEVMLAVRFARPVALLIQSYLRRP
jgi:hypothetical protein